MKLILYTTNYVKNRAPCIDLQDVQSSNRSLQLIQGLVDGFTDHFLHEYNVTWMKQVRTYICFESVCSWAKSLSSSSHCVINSTVFPVHSLTSSESFCIDCLYISLDSAVDDDICNKSKMSHEMENKAACSNSVLVSSAFAAVGSHC